jgi:hypothetical protein
MRIGRMHHRISFLWTITRVCRDSSYKQPVDIRVDLILSLHQYDCVRNQPTIALVWFVLYWALYHNDCQDSLMQALIMPGITIGHGDSGPGCFTPTHEPYTTKWQLFGWEVTLHYNPDSLHTCAVLVIRIDHKSLISLVHAM